MMMNRTAFTANKSVGNFSVFSKDLKSTISAYELEGLERLHIQGIYNPKPRGPNKVQRVIKDRVQNDAEIDKKIKEIELKNEEAEQWRLLEKEKEHKLKKERHIDYVKWTLAYNAHQNFLHQNMKNEFKIELINDVLTKEEKRQKSLQEQRNKQLEYQREDDEYEWKLR